MEASRVPEVSEMVVVFLTVKSTSPWICMPRCVASTFSVSSEAPDAMYSTIDMPIHAEPAGTPSKPGGAEGSPMIRLLGVEAYLMLSTSIDGDTAYDILACTVPAA